MERARIGSGGRRGVRAVWRLAAAAALLVATQAGAEPAPPEIASPARTLERLRHILPQSQPWEDWLSRTGELPPDFGALPSNPGLPDPLRFADHTRVSSAADWVRRREELLRLFQHYVIGTVPPPPGNVRVAESVERAEPLAVVREVALAFGPGHAARLHLEVIRPAGPGPFPVFLTQANHRRWGLIAVSRGYLAAVYAGADQRDDTGPWSEIWPDYDWTKLTRRAWAASRCVDYLETLPEVDRAHIALTGHSRNGKTALIAAALDDRITAVISSSSGAGGACTWRLFSESQFGEGIELITRSFPDWLHPRLRFFVGRENRLPIDQHELVACIAPRAVLISTALNDNVESAWAVERTRSAALPVFELLGGGGNLNLRYRAGSHATDADDIECYLDWLDVKFGRGPPVAGDAPIFPTYEDWRRCGGEPIEPALLPERRWGTLLDAPDGSRITEVSAWVVRRSELEQRVLDVLGPAPSQASDPSGSYGAESTAVAALLARQSTPARLVKESLSFGNYVAGDLYYPTNVSGTDRRLPTFIWLHPVSVSHGYVAGYHRGEQPHLALTRSGSAVFAFDQIGNGNRIEEVRRFYARYPRWSLLGKMVADTRAAVDALRQQPHVDPDQIYLAGYGAGSLVAVHAAALDPRVAGVVAVGDIQSWRPDAGTARTGVIARWSQELPLVPRLAAFIGLESRLPYDVEELLALIAPRPVLLIVPGADYQTGQDQLRQAVAEARKVFELLGAPQNLKLQRTDDYDHFSPDLVWCLCGTQTVP